jgi:hypothetical protein
VSGYCDRIEMQKEKEEDRNDNDTISLYAFFASANISLK